MSLKKKLLTPTWLKTFSKSNFYLKIYLKNQSSQLDWFFFEIILFGICLKKHYFSALLMNTYYV